MNGKPAYETVMEICFRNRIYGVSVFRGVAGYEKNRAIHTAKILELSSNLPVKIEIIDSEEAIISVMPEITAVITKGLVEISGTTIVETGR